MSEPNTALERAVEVLGSQSKVAAEVGVTPQAVSDAVRKGRDVPAEWCIPLEKATIRKVREDGRGTPVMRHQLRPDIYPPHEDASAA